jgi:hypothetical protein
VTATNTSVVVRYAAPASTGTSKIRSYTARCSSSNGGATRTRTQTKGPLTVGSLTVGKRYTCQVRATNRSGSGAWSTRSAAFVVTTVPGAPRNVTVSQPGDGARVAFTPPATGGSPILNYVVTCTSANGGVTRVKASAQSPVLLTDLGIGSTYRCSVVARNAVGTGRPSAATAAFTSARGSLSESGCLVFDPDPDPSFRPVMQLQLAQDSVVASTTSGLINIEDGPGPAIQPGEIFGATTNGIDEVGFATTEAAQGTIEMSFTNGLVLTAEYDCTD